MNFQFRGDGEGFSIHIKVEWPSFQALLKAVIATVVVVAALSAALANFHP